MIGSILPKFSETVVICTHLESYQTTLASMTMCMQGHDVEEASADETYKLDY